MHFWIKYFIFETWPCFSQNMHMADNSMIYGDIGQELNCKKADEAVKYSSYVALNAFCLFLKVLFNKTNSILLL